MPKLDDQTVFTVQASDLLDVHVRARSEFEARMWAANKDSLWKPFCTLQRRLPHLGPVCALCRCCYSHCKCPTQGVVQ